MRLNDLVLFAVVFGSAAAAVFLPALGEVFHPYLLVVMMCLLFLSFIKIDFRALMDISLSAVAPLSVLVAAKLLVLPALLYWGTEMILPDYAVPVLLLSGISTGVVAPFMATLVAADVTPVLRMVIVTSVLVPFSLPAIVKALVGAEIAIPLLAMIRMLATVIFPPLFAVALMRRYAPGALRRIDDRSFPVSMVLFGMANLGVFCKYSQFFFQNPGQLFVSVGVAYALSVIYYLSGFVLTPGRAPQQRLSAAVSFAIMNNVLVIVFASKFFGPLSPTLAAMYMFPFFTMIVPVNLIVHRTSATTGKAISQP